MDLLKTIQSAIIGGKQQQPTVKEINIYPIKSCAEIQVSTASITPRGFEYDRIFQVVTNVDGVWSFCTPRERAYEKLFHIKPSISDDGKQLTLTSPYAKEKFLLELEGAATTQLETTVMGGNKVLLNDYGVEVSKWLKEATGIDDAHLVGYIDNKDFHRGVEVGDQGEALPPSSTAPIPVSLADEAPFLLTTQPSLSDLNIRLKSNGKDQIDMRRFRPNIVLDGLKPYEEDSLKRIKINSTEFHVWQRCGRCTMTTIDRDTLKRCGEPLNTLNTFRERENGLRNFGMHLIPALDNVNEDMGSISVGDSVEVLEYDEDRKAEWTRLFGK